MRTGEFRVEFYCWLSTTEQAINILQNWKALIIRKRDAFKIITVIIDWINIT